MLVFEEDSKFSNFWRYFYILMCLVSTYIYIFACVFGIQKIILENMILDYNIELWMEGFFALNILKNFWTTYSHKDCGRKVRSPGRIALNYIKGRFIYDLLPTIPITYFITEFNPALDLLYLFKMSRLKTGLKFLDSREWVKIIANTHKQRAIRRIKYDLEFAEDTINDNNNFELILLLKYLLSTLELVITIFNISFLIGMAWLKVT